MWSAKFNYNVFDYINHIHKRIKKKNLVDLSTVPIRLNHNDLSLDNIILSTKGLKIIDNEFLGCNTGWILNIRNSFLKEDFDYQNFVSKKTLDQLWSLRREWGNLITKKDIKSTQSFNFIKKFFLKFK
jgi:thiamine kinase-like enzyme